MILGFIINTIVTPSSLILLEFCEYFDNLKENKTSLKELGLTSQNEELFRTCLPRLGGDGDIFRPF